MDDVLVNGTRGPLDSPPRPSVDPSAKVLRLFGGFDASEHGRPIILVQAAERVLAYVAINGRTSRSVVAGRLWPEQARAQGLANVRTALWRMREHPGWLDSPGTSIELGEQVCVDVSAVLAGACDTLERLVAMPPGDLLPDWDAEWVDEERDRLRELRIRALTTQGRLMLEARRFELALLAAYTAVRLDPLRESAHRLVVESHVAEGDYAVAQRHYEGYRELLAAELGVLPSPQIRQLLDVIPRRSRRG